MREKNNIKLITYHLHRAMVLSRNRMKLILPLLLPQLAPLQLLLMPHKIHFNFILVVFTMNQRAHQLILIMVCWLLDMVMMEGNIQLIITLSKTHGVKDGVMQVTS